MNKKHRFIIARRQLTALLFSAAIAYLLMQLTYAVYYSWWFLLSALGFLGFVWLAIFFAYHLFKTITPGIGLWWDQKLKDRRMHTEWSRRRRSHQYPGEPAPFYIHGVPPDTN